MVLTDYTTYAEVRAALGVSDAELDDVTLSLDLYRQHLSAELASVSSGLKTEYAAVVDIAEASWTEKQETFYSATRLFATYAVALHVCSALGNIAPKDITDGKAAVTRYADSPYKEVKKDIEKLDAKYRMRLKEAFEALTAGSAVIRPFVMPVFAAGAGVNIVTGA